MIYQIPNGELVFNRLGFLQLIRVRLPYRKAKETKVELITQLIRKWGIPYNVDYVKPIVVYRDDTFGYGVLIQDEEDGGKSMLFHREKLQQLPAEPSLPLEF